MGEASRVERLKDAAREMAESKKKLEDEFRGRLPNHPDADDSFINEILTDAERDGRHKGKGRHGHKHHRRARRKDFEDEQDDETGDVLPMPHKKRQHRDEAFTDEEDT